MFLGLLQIGALLGGASTKNTPQLQNLAMELRKVCCHPVSGSFHSDLTLSLASCSSSFPAVLSASWPIENSINVIFVFLHVHRLVKLPCKSCASFHMKENVLRYAELKFVIDMLLHCTQSSI